MDVSELNLYGSHPLAKKGGESVVYQGRKKAKTSIFCQFSQTGYVLASTGIVAGNHNDAFNLKQISIGIQMDQATKTYRFRVLTSMADSAFDTREAARFGFNHKLLPNIPEITQSEAGRARTTTYVQSDCVQRRFTAERSCLGR